METKNMRDGRCAAWTDVVGTYPQFLNATLVGEVVRIYARSQQAVDNDGVSVGSTALVEIPVDTFRGWIEEANWLTDPANRSCDEAGCERADRYCRMGGCEYADHGFPPCKVWGADHGR